MSNRPRSVKPRSLKLRALQLLAQREQSRVELRRKLMTHVTAESTAQARLAEPSRKCLEESVVADFASLAAATFDGADDKDATTRPTDAADDAAAQVDAVMVWLEAHQFISDERFAESRVHARASRFGNLRIRQELKQHGVVLCGETARALQQSEYSRALDVWERRFGQAPQTAAASSKQARFLIARGFAPEVVWRVLRLRRIDTGDAESDSTVAGE